MMLRPGFGALWLIALQVVSLAAKPNFIVMLMDDMGWGDLGIYGQPAKETPNLDQMAAEGMLFTDFYSAASICSPSRASLLSGRLPIRNGFYSNNSKACNSYAPQVVIGGIPDTEILFSEVLQKNGYKNKIVGKWHLGHQAQYLPHRHGFDEWFGAPDCHYKYDDVKIPNIPVYRDDKMIGRYYDDFYIDQDAGISNMTQLYIEEALKFIETEAHSDQPFLLYWAPDATHTPLYASSQFRGRSQRGLYGDAVMELDSGVGQILAKVRQLGIEDNTFVFFSSDNGAATYAKEQGGSAGPFLCGKQTTFEGGHREPGIAWWPGRIKPNKISRQSGNLMDIYQTLLDFADIPPPEGLQFDGISLVPVLLNETEFERPTFYYRGDTLFKVRLGQYKAHFYTWDTPQGSQLLGYHYCVGQYIANVTTKEMTNYTTRPLLFHLGRDPGEKFFLDFESDEYKQAMTAIMKVTEEHQRNLKYGEPQLNWCDEAAQNWAPEGCEEINRCLPKPPSKPFKCVWLY